jgi:RecG-like helicase
MDAALKQLEAGTRVWAIDEVRALAAADEPADRLLVFEADAGMGKTVIAAAAVEALRKAGYFVVSGY